jgi:hypothetical protein
MTIKTENYYVITLKKIGVYNNTKNRPKQFKQ